MENLIAHLLNRQISLEEACEELGISPKLTYEQEVELYGTIFQCSICGFWQEVCDIGYNGFDGLVCRDCEEEEEDD